MSKNLLTIIILNWNGKELLSRCLKALEEQAFRRFSVIVADNGSADGSVEWVRQEYPQMEVIALSQNLGFSAANNIALKKVCTPYVALLNNDAFVHPLWAEKMIAALESNPEAGFAASKLMFADHPEVIDRAGDGYTLAGTGLLRGRGKSANDYDKPEWVFGACAAAAVYRTRMLQHIGLFDEDFFLLYEDVDLSFRAQLRGYKCLYVPEAVVFHKSSGSIGHDSPISVYYSHRNLEWVYLQNMPSVLLLKTLPYHIFYDISAFLYFAFTGRIREYLKAKTDAFRGVKKALSKRRIIQSQRCVNDCYIRQLLTQELFLPRLLRRFPKFRKSV